MPQIIVTAGDAANLEGTVTLRERINETDFASERFAVNLLERLGWAVSDATDAEQRATDIEQGATHPEQRATHPEQGAADPAQTADKVERSAPRRPELVEA
jgi:hypothetical protein